MALSLDELIELNGTAKASFQTLDDARGSVLTRARDASALTIPSVLPNDGHDEEATRVSANPMLSPGTRRPATSRQNVHPKHAVIIH